MHQQVIVKGNEDKFRLNSLLTIPKTNISPFDTAIPDPITAKTLSRLERKTNFDVEGNNLDLESGFKRQKSGEFNDEISAELAFAKRRAKRHSLMEGALLNKFAMGGKLEQIPRSGTMSTKALERKNNTVRELRQQGSYGPSEEEGGSDTPLEWNRLGSMPLNSPARSMDEVEKAEGHSLYFFGPSNTIRLFLLKIIENPKFDMIILFFIFASSILLILENPLDDPDGEKIKIIKILDIIMTAIFTLECIIKIIAYGFLFNGSKSYLRNTWNIMDFVIVILAVSNIYIYIYIDCVFVSGWKHVPNLQSI